MSDRTDEPIGYWVKRVDAMLDDRFAGAVSAGGLTRRHWQVLTVLTDGRSDAESTDGVLRGFGSELNDLSLRGWVRRSPDGYEATLEGQVEYRRLLDELAAARAHLTDGVDPVDYVAAVRVLQRIVANLAGRDTHR
jgi:hypothetical protein